MTIIFYAGMGQSGEGVGVGGRVMLVIRKEANKFIHSFMVLRAVNKGRNP